MIDKICKCCFLFCALHCYQNTVECQKQYLGGLYFGKLCGIVGTNFPDSLLYGNWIYSKTLAKARRKNPMANE